MKRIKNKTFHDLVEENKQALLTDQHALEKIEEKLEERYMKRA